MRGASDRENGRYYHHFFETPVFFNTAKLSSPLLLPRTGGSYDPGASHTPQPSRRGSVYRTTIMADQSKGGSTGRRRRSSSILQVYHEPLETLEQISDQAALPNLNANWVNAKGEREQKPGGAYTWKAALRPRGSRTTGSWTGSNLFSPPP